MPHYTFSYANPAAKLVQVNILFENISSETTILQLPAWRPGRYELGNFAQNIVSLKISSEEKNLPFKKITKDRWEVNTHGISAFEVAYTYYAAELNAGSTYLCSDFLYVNPVNCCMYAEEKMHEPCTIELQVPDNFETANGLPSQGKNIYAAKDFHELADSPFISGTTLQKKTYQSHGVDFHVWFNGKIEPDWNKVLRDFKAFTDEQYEAFGSFPFPEFHFLIHALPYQAYHGVEHLTSTVISLGPSEKIMGDLYEELLGVSSHELYHCWNIKTIRPKEMMPYDYSKENYSRLGYVAEGVTTYMGDLMLLRSHVFNRDEWKKTFDSLLERHFQNFGRFNMSVAESSYDTWIDGYKQGAPYRKVSIYTEGALCAFMADVLIMKATGNRKNLSHTMQWLYEHFGKKEKGYTEKDFQWALETVSGISFHEFFDQYYHGTYDYEPLLRECLEYLGYELKITNRYNLHETAFGIKVLKEGNAFVVKAIYPECEAQQKGLELGDKILSINNEELKEISQLKNAAEATHIKLKIQNSFLEEREIELNTGNYFKKYFIERQQEISEAQARSYAVWAGVVEN